MKILHRLFFFGFGASIGFRKPAVFFVSSRTALTELAAMLQGWDFHVYDSYEDVSDYLAHQGRNLMNEAISVKIPQEYWEFGEYKVQVLKDINDLIHRDMTFEDRIQGLLILALYALRTDAGSIMIVSHINEALVMKALVSPNATLMDVGTWRTFGYGEGIAGWVWKNKTPYRVSNIRNEPQYVKKTFDPNLISLLCVPIIYGENVIGVINCDSKREDHFREDDEKFLKKISQVIAPSIYKEYFRESFEEKRTIFDSETTVQRLFRDPFCLKCGHEHRFRFVRKKDEEGLRFKLTIACDNCGTDELVRTYTL